MLRKIAWTALVTATSTLAADLAVKLSRSLWRRFAKSEPPSSSRWLERLVGTPIERTVHRRRRVRRTP